MYSSYVDWGVNAISNGGDAPELWRTLKIEEWRYILTSRPNAENLQGRATVEGVTGTVLLADNYVPKRGLDFTPNTKGWNTNVYTAEQWRVLEDRGALRH